MRTKIIVRENSRVSTVCKTAISRCVYVNFLQTEESNDINRGNFVTKTKMEKNNNKRRKKKNATWQRESRLEITIFISIKENGTLVRYSPSPRIIYYPSVQKIIPLLRQRTPCYR